MLTVAREVYRITLLNWQPLHFVIIIFKAKIRNIEYIQLYQILIKAETKPFPTIG